MDSKVIDGNALAKRHEAAIKERLSRIKKDRNPAVVSFCNQDDPASQKYTFMKLAKASDLGIDFIAEEFSADTGREYLESLVKKYAADPGIDGILVQLPIPENLNPFREGLLNLIPAEKDVDGLLESSPFLPATVKAVISILNSLLRHSGLDPESQKTEILKQVQDDNSVGGVWWKDKKIAVVGATGEVGKPLVKYLKENNVEVVEISRNLGDLVSDLEDADIVVSATGEENLIKENMIKTGAILIDVGLGDFDPGCFQKASLYTPKIGGVGPMTVISLMENVTEAFLRKLKSS